MTNSRTSSKAGSWFLGIPLEIRREIYRCLLLDPLECYLSTPWYLDDDDDAPPKVTGGFCTAHHTCHGTDNQADFCKYKYNDSDSDTDYSSMDISSKTEDGEATMAGESEMQDRHKSVGRQATDTKSPVRRYPAILCTNRQIYHEASSLLYTELEVNVQPGDVLCMNTGKDIVNASENLWRHNPLHGIGITNSSGQTTYETSEFDGFMEPHVFARFKRVVFDIDLNWEMDALEALNSHQPAGDQTAPTLFVNDNFTVNPEDEARLLAFYRRSTIVHQLVKVLSNSHDIASLHIPINIEVLAQYDMSLDSDSDSDPEESDDESSDTSRKMDVANERALELFLDSGLLASLEKLSNVRHLQFKFDPLDWDYEKGTTPPNIDDMFYKPKPKHDRMLRDLKQKIERNYAVRHG